MEAINERHQITLQLSEDEALVLSHWLYRFNANKQPVFEDQAEQRILWDIESSLEKILTILVASNYAEQLAIAREKVRNPT